MSDDDKLYLPKIVIPYRMHPSFGNTKMPIVDITLPSLPQPVVALVDSGATSSLLNPIVAMVAGIKPRKGQQTFSGSGVSASYQYWTADPVEVEISNQLFNFQFDVIMQEDMPWPCILGHNTIFKYAKIEFKSFREEFSIRIRNDIN